MSLESYYKENTMDTMNFFRRMSLNMIQLTSVVQAPWFRCVSEYQSVDLSIISFAFVFILLTSSLYCYDYKDTSLWRFPVPPSGSRAPGQNSPGTWQIKLNKYLLFSSIQLFNYKLKVIVLKGNIDSTYHFTSGNIPFRPSTTLSLSLNIVSI